VDEGDLKKDGHAPSTPSRLLETMNGVLSGVGGKAELSKVTDRGLVIPA
jgi:hypothetical protein